jgi:hypothetical protein
MRKPNRQVNNMALEVNGEKIKEEVIRAEWDFLKAHYQNTLAAEQFAKIEPTLLMLAKENVIARLLFEKASFEADLPVDFSLINEEYQKMLAHYGGEVNLREHMAEQDRIFDAQEIKEGIEKSLKVDAFVKQVIDDNGPIDVSEDEILAEKASMKEQGIHLENLKSDEIKDALVKVILKKKQNNVLREFKKKLRTTASVTGLGESL